MDSWKNSKIIIEKVTKEKRDELNKSDPNEINRVIDSMLGFTKIFRLLIQFKKPIILHCGFMDLLFIYEKFYEPLPDTISQFKKKINELFPVIYDTKHVSFESKRVIWLNKHITSLFLISFLLKLNKVVKEMFDSTILENLFSKFIFNIQILKNIWSNWF